jgi:tetratricopeptide (TPR) repeat protein
MVFGCLGGVVAFGLKYRSLLPSKYRGILGDAAIPSVLGLLLIGLTSHGVDNWAHVGGLVAGLLTGAFMQPRLLTDARHFWWEPALRAAPSLGVLAVVFFGQPLFFGNVLPVMHVERDDAFGISMPIPRSWVRGANPLGTLAWYNGLVGLGRASVAAEAVEMAEGADATLQAARFSTERLVPRALGAEVLSVRTELPEAVRVGDRDAVRLRATIEETSGTTRLLAWFVPRGMTVFQVVFVWPASFPKYATVAEQMMSLVRFEEPRDLRLVRGEALIFPNSPPALARLGVAMLQQGDAVPAADALSAAVRGAPGEVGWRVALSRAWLIAGDVERGCAASQDAMAYAPEDPFVLEADARCELARGNAQQALEQLGRARQSAPNDERLRAVEARLRNALKL